MLNANAILHDFFIEGLDLDLIAARHETCWREITAIVSSETAMQTMRDAIRAERLRDIALNLASRRFAIRTLETVIHDRGLTAVGHEGRRRAADAILRATTPRGRAAARPKLTRPSPSLPPPSSPPEPEKQIAPVHGEPVHQPAEPSRSSNPVVRVQPHSARTQQSPCQHQPARAASGTENSS